MSVFTSPVTINNGADHIFSFRSQVPTNNAKSVAGEWIEGAAPIADESKLTVKHDASSPTVRRRLLSRKVNRTTVTRGSRPITVNISVAYDVEHTQAQIEDEIKLIDTAIGIANFRANFIAGHI